MYPISDTFSNQTDKNGHFQTLIQLYSDVSSFVLKMAREGKIANPKVIKHFSCSSQLSMKFQLLIITKILKNIDFSCFEISDIVFILLTYVKMPKIVRILTFMSTVSLGMKRPARDLVRVKTFIFASGFIDNSYHAQELVVHIHPFKPNGISHSYQLE